jgi:hypothetical protein
VPDKSENKNSQFVPPAEAIKTVKPRIIGGGFSKGTRDLGPSKRHDPWISGGGKSVSQFPWGESKPSGVASAVFNQSSRAPASRPPMEARATSRGAGDFVIDGTLKSTMM